MKKQTSKRNSNRVKRHIPRLENIHTLIDSKHFDCDLVSDQLQLVNLKFLSPYHQVYHYYLSAKLHFRCYQKENAIEHLELASDLLDTMDTLAYEKGVRNNKEEYHFTRAYIKLVLAKVSWDTDSSPYYLAKATRITDKALEFNSNSKGFLWLKSQLSA